MEDSSALERAFEEEIPAVVFDRVNLAFDESVILKDLAFTLEEGHTKIILGASGAEKSTVLKLILGLLKPDSGEIFVNGQLVKLRPTDYRLLYHLVQNAGWVVSHDQLLAKVLGYEYQSETHYLRLYVNYLRDKLEADPRDPKYILTERGVGYRFVDYKRLSDK